MISRENIIDALKKVVDPELHIDIWTLGLIYEIYEIKEEDEKVKIKMTLTSPMCPFGPQIIADVKEQVSLVPEVKEVDIEMVFVPAWEPTEELKLMMGVIM